MKNTKVILFSGCARNGKDQSAEFLKELLEQSGKTVLVYHFADALKTLCETSYGWTRGDKGPIGRTILQNVGTIYRKNNPQCWVKIAEQIVLGCDKEYVLIPDCRYKNEASGFGLFEKTIIRVERPNFDNGLTEEQRKHQSENDLNDYPFDWILLNNGSLEDLRKKIKKEFGL